MPAARSALRDLLIVGDAVAVEHEHDDRALRGALFIFAEALEAEEEARDADRDAGGRHLLAGEALDEAVIAAAAHHRAEPDRLSALVLDGSGQLGLEHGAGVILQARARRRTIEPIIRSSHSAAILELAQQSVVDLLRARSNPSTSPVCRILARTSSDDPSDLQAPTYESAALRRSLRRSSPSMGINRCHR